MRWVNQQYRAAVYDAKAVHERICLKAALWATCGMTKARFVLVAKSACAALVAALWGVHWALSFDVLDTYLFHLLRRQSKNHRIDSKCRA